MEIKELGFYLWELSWMLFGNLGKYLSACPDYARFPGDTASSIVTLEKVCHAFNSIKNRF